MPPGAEIDRQQLAEAVRGSLAGEGSIWGLNPVPAIAQLEEALYAAGVTDITQAWTETAALLGLPTLGKSLAHRVRDAYWEGK